MHLYDLIGGKCKIRKRSSTSSSTFSSTPQSYRFKRSVVITNKRTTGGDVVAPLDTAPPMKGSSRSTATILRIPRSPIGTPLQSRSGSGRRKEQRRPISARKLAASLWEMNSPGFKDGTGLRRSKELRSGERVGSGYLPARLSDPLHSFISEEGMDHSGDGSYCGRHSMQVLHRIRGSDSISNSSFKQIETRFQRLIPTNPIFEVNPHLRKLHNGLTTSKELLRILSRMWRSREHYLAGKSIITALCTEFERASEHADHLIQEKYSCHKEMNNLMKNYAEEKAIWKKKVHERVETSFKSILNDLEMERKLRKRSESLTKTLSRELAETKATLSDVMDQLENEKRVREIMERVSDELARGIGEDKALVEQMKKETSKVKEEVEKEREMLHLADVLREERVQMKLIDAKYHFEEKNAAVDKLRSDLETFLRSKEDIESHLNSQNPVGKIEVGANLINTMATYQHGEMGGGKNGLEYGEGLRHLNHDDDLSESDLHSIELNKGGNNMNCVWTLENDQERPFVDKIVKGRKSSSRKVTRGRNSFERCTLDGIEMNFNANGTNEAHGKHSEAERQRSRSIKDLRDYISSNSRLASSHCNSSPVKV